MHVVPEYTLVVSDLHLCGVVPDGQTWLGYRARRHRFDAALAVLLRTGLAQARADRAALTVVFNGDAFDLDAPDTRRWPPSPAELAPRTDAATAGVLGAILDDHPAALASLADVARGGGRLVFVAGNHDAYLALPATQAALAARVAGAAGPDAAPVAFRRFAHRGAGGLHVEHGHQYDPGCALATPRAPARATLGSIATRCAPVALGCFNPYGIDPLAIGARELARSFRACLGADSTLLPAQLAATGSGARAADAEADARALAAECDAPLATARAHVALAVAPAGLAWLAAAREEAYGVEVERRQREAARALARTWGAAAVVIGHTHAAYGERDGGVFYGNTGTWAPAIGRAPGAPVGHYAWACAAGGGAARVAVHPCLERSAA